MNDSALVDNYSEEGHPFNVGETQYPYARFTAPPVTKGIGAAEGPGLTAIAPDGSAVLFQNETIGFNIAGHPGQC